MTLPLTGIKVLEFSEHGFVPSACAALADWGADVVKIERLEGDPMRQIIRQGLVADADGYDYLFQLVNRNKRGVSIDVLYPPVVKSSSAWWPGLTCTSPISCPECDANCTPSPKTCSN